MIHVTVIVEIFFQNHFGCLSHGLPKPVHPAHILIYKLTFNKHSRSFIRIQNKNERVGGLCVKSNLLCMEKRAERAAQRSSLSAAPFLAVLNTSDQDPPKSHLSSCLIFQTKCEYILLKMALLISMIFPSSSIYFGRKTLFRNNNKNLLISQRYRFVCQWTFWFLNKETLAIFNFFFVP